MSGTSTAFRVVAVISRDSFYGRCGAGEGRRGFSGREGPRRHGDNCLYPLSARHRQANQLPIMAPFEVVNDFAREVLTHAGALIANVLRGSERALLEQLKLDFSGVRRVKPLEAEAMRRHVRGCDGFSRWPTIDVVLRSARDHRFQRSKYPAS